MRVRCGELKKFMSIEALVHNSSNIIGNRHDALSVYVLCPSRASLILYRSIVFLCALGACAFLHNLVLFFYFGINRVAVKLLRIARPVQMRQEAAYREATMVHDWPARCNPPER
jgi:hypothetical protein